MSYTTDLLLALGMLGARKRMASSTDPEKVEFATSRWGGPEAIGAQFNRVFESSVDGGEYANMWRMTQAQFAERWLGCGLPRIEMSHAKAAALMATTIPDESVESLVVPPWVAFMVAVPHGLLPMESASGAWTSADVVLAQAIHALDGTTQWVWMVTGHNNGTDGAIVHGRLLETASDEVAVEASLSGLGGGTVPKDALRVHQRFGSLRRLLESARRLIVGCCIHMSDPRQFVHASKPKSVSGKRGGRGSTIPARFDTFRLIGDVKVDVRKAVTEYVRHGGKSPTVQSMVRGHWKHQTHGPGGAQRKLIHVEPYWRGPEDAPIAIRSHVVEADA